MVQNDAATPSFTTSMQLDDTYDPTINWFEPGPFCDLAPDWSEVDRIEEEQRQKRRERIRKQRRVAERREAFKVPFVELRFYMPGADPDADPYEIRHASESGGISDAVALLKAMGGLGRFAEHATGRVTLTPPVSAPPSDCGDEVESM